ncbi:MAG TPA: L,D-transpeptidase family protein [Solirubrobacteraceae bacterium]
MIAPAVLVAAIVVVFAVFATSQPSVASDATALAKVDMALGGGKVVSVRATGPNDRAIPVRLTGGRIVPKVKLRPDERVSVVAVIKRPGWIGWLAGSRDTERLSLSTPTTSLDDQYLTLAAGAPLRLTFSHPVSTFAYGQPGALQHRTFAQLQASVTIARPAPAGTLTVAAAPRAWETASTTSVAWFPAGAPTSALANPAPGRNITATTPITLTFSKPYSQILGSAWPKLSPDPAGTWSAIDSHTIEFKPSGYGFGLGTTIGVDLPSGVQVVVGHASWTVPQGSSLRVNQILAQLGYLPVRWHPDSRPVPATAGAQLTAAVKPPAGSFSWIYGNTPSSLEGQWDPNHQTVVTQGALMAFEQNQNMYGTDPTPAQVWRALISAAIKDQRSSFGYTYVMVSEGSPESLNLWHNGRTVLTTPVNTGIPSAPTDTGTYPVFEHLPVTTMTGTNPDGSAYSDPGIPWVSYFHGGDALHGFIRGSYGSPQSLGCVEMPFSTAGRVYPFTPIGTLVNVE